MQIKLNNIVVDIEDIYMSLQTNNMDEKVTNASRNTVRDLVAEISKESYTSNEVKLEVL